MPEVAPVTSATLKLSAMRCTLSLPLPLSRHGEEDDNNYVYENDTMRRRRSARVSDTARKDRQAQPLVRRRSDSGALAW